MLTSQDTDVAGGCCRAGCALTLKLGFVSCEVEIIRTSSERVVLWVKWEDMSKHNLAHNVLPMYLKMQNLQRVRAEKTW